MGWTGGFLSRSDLQTTVRARGENLFCSTVIINRKQECRDVQHVTVLLKIHMPWSLPGVLFYKAYGLTDKMISDLETWTDNFGDKQKPGWLHLSGLFHLHAAYWHLRVCIRKLCFSAPFPPSPQKSGSICPCVSWLGACIQLQAPGHDLFKGFCHLFWLAVLAVACWGNGLVAGSGLKHEVLLPSFSGGQELATGLWVKLVLFLWCQRVIHRCRSSDIFFWMTKALGVGPCRLLPFQSVVRVSRNPRSSLSFLEIFHLIGLSGCVSLLFPALSPGSCRSHASLALSWTDYLCHCWIQRPDNGLENPPGLFLEMIVLHQHLHDHSIQALIWIGSCSAQNCSSGSVPLRGRVVFPWDHAPVCPNQFGQ